MSGLEVVAAVISLIDASIKTFDFIKKKKDIPQRFKAISEKLPIMRDTLQELQNETNTRLGRSWPEFQTLIEQCRKDAETLSKLVTIFKKDGPPPKRERYTQWINSMGQEQRAESLVKRISDNIQALYQCSTLESAHDQIRELKKISTEMTVLASKVEDLSTSGSTSQTYYQYGEGSQNIQQGLASQYNIDSSRTGSGTLHNIAHQENRHVTDNGTAGWWHDTD